MKRILVTGAGGYIGRHVVKALVDGGHPVIAADICVDGIDSRAQRMSIDIFSGDPAIYQNLDSPDVMIHLAWRDGFVHNSLLHMEYLPKHYVFLRDMLAGGLGQVVVMGTVHEVGYHEGEVDEHTPTNPMSLYGIAKNALRQACILLQGEYPDVVFQWLRGYYIYGDDARNHSIFAKLLEAVDQGKRTFPFTSGRNLYDFISVEELARQIAACATQREITGVINCCSGKPVSLAQQVEAFIQDRGLDIRLDYGAFPDRAYDSPGIWGSNEKIRKIMGL